MLCDQQCAARKVGRAQDDRELKRGCLHLEEATESASYQAANGQKAIAKVLSSDGVETFKKSPVLRFGGRKQSFLTHQQGDI
jgi:hypothetical protein